MFTQNWRQHWGLREDPFACEDADKDQILTDVDPSAVHSGFDRIFGNPRVPSPGIVFGEKGSGKTGIRLMMRRWLGGFNERHPDEKVFCVEYVDFDSAIERLQRATNVRGGAEKAANKVLKEWQTSDHLDAILSLGVTRLVDELLNGEASAKGLSPKQRVDLMLLTVLYYESSHRSVGDALAGVRHAVRASSGRMAGVRFGQIVGSLLCVAIALLPHLVQVELGPAQMWYGIGGGLLALLWGYAGFAKFRVVTQAQRAARAVRTLDRAPALLADVLFSLKPSARKDYTLPAATDSATRYELLGHVSGILGSVGYHGWYVLMDRVDEPSLLSGNDERMRAFVASILDIKILQFPNLALKLFLPIEMESLYRNATAEELKRMRLDKSNLIPELKWTGRELYEIANQRLTACLESEAPVESLMDLFEEGFDGQNLRETLTTLGTPRYAFGFLSALFLEHVRDLPNDMAPDDPRWRCSRSQFDVVRASWIDRTGILRRSLN